MTTIERLREALSRIAEVAGTAVDSSEMLDDEYNGGDELEQAGMLGCTLKALPTRLLVRAAETAVRVNPVNAPAFGPLAAVDGDFQVSEPLRIAVLTAKYWGPTPRRLTVSFMEQTPANLRAKIIGHLNAWTKTGCISFVATSGIGKVRISRGPGGYYSYLGTDILHIPQNRQTMNLQGFTMNTAESEFKRVIRHEAGHTLGFPHEHMRKALVARIDPAKAYAWFLQMYGWDKATVDAQVLTPLSEASIFGTPPDQTSIMCYQLPGSITKDGKPITGGKDINSTDYTFAAKIYPKASQAMASAWMAGVPADDRPDSDDAAAADWPESDDVAAADVAAEA